MEHGREHVAWYIYDCSDTLTAALLEAWSILAPLDSYEILLLLSAKLLTTKRRTLDGVGEVSTCLYMVWFFTMELDRVTMVSVPPVIPSSARGGKLEI